MDEVVALLADDAEGDLVTPPFGSEDAPFRMVAERDVKRLYLLADGKLDKLPVAQSKPAPNVDLASSLADDHMRLYALADVEALALSVHGSEEELVRKRKSLWELAAKASKTVGRTARARRVSQKSGSSGSSGGDAGWVPGTKAVYTAIATNSIICVSKAVAFAFSGSGALLAETLHSAADVGNQSLLAVGIAKSTRESDEVHPYGYGSERYVWSLISGVGVFFLGCGASVYHGIHSLLHPQPVEAQTMALAVLGLSFALEAYSSAVAVAEIRKEAAKVNVSFLEYVTNGSDPMNTAVLLEDGAALVGVGIAAGAIGLTAVTGNPMYDALGSIAIGGLLGGVATFLIAKNRAALLGKSISPDKLRTVRRLLESDPMVASVHGVRAVSLGADNARLAADINFDAAALARAAWPDLDASYTEITSLRSIEEVHAWQKAASLLLIERIGAEVDRLEQVVHTAVPEIRYITLEVL